jgi:Ca2+-binding EF-hand superfamily protein
MRSLLCVSLVFMFATTAAAQFSKSVPRTSTKTSDTAARKTTEKARPERPGKGADQANTDSDLANSILAIMDTDGDGIVTKAEFGKAMAALRKVHKDKQGNMQVDKLSNGADAVAGADATNGAGGPNGGAGGNEAMARFMQYDRNHDGRLTPDEVPPQGRAMLQGADLNGDGAIDASELQAFAKRMGDRAKAWAAGVNPNNPNGANNVPGDGRRPKQ